MKKDKINLLNVKKEGFYYFMDRGSGSIHLSDINIYNLIELKKGFFDSSINISDEDIICLSKKAGTNINMIKESIKRLKFLSKHHQIKPFCAIKQEYYNDLDKEFILTQIANTKQLIIQTTTRCNLDCIYCTDGKLYKNFSSDSRNDLEKIKSFQFLDYVLKLQQSYRNRSYNKVLYITFYGGEPLLNFETIKSVVNHTKKIQDDQLKFQFSITTNGILLKKHVMFLIENNFKINVSLDGNRKDNRLRILKDGRESFSLVYGNLKWVQEKHPVFFKKNINILSVLHRYNKLVDVYKYFSRSFEKVPNVSTLSTDNIDENHIAYFNDLYKEFKLSEEDLKKIIELYTYDYNNIFENRDKLQSYLNKELDSLNSFFPSKSKCNYPTGTCLPFENRIYLTAEGNIYPCERINPKFVFGEINQQGVNIYFDKIKAYYSEIINELDSKCSKCSNHTLCDECYFKGSSNFLEKTPKCFSATSSQIDNIKTVI